MDMNHRPSAVMPRCEQDAAFAAVVFHVLQAAHQERDAANTAEKTDGSSPAPWTAHRQLAAELSVAFPNSMRTEKGDPHRRIPAHVFRPRQRPLTTSRAVHRRRALGQVLQRRRDVVLALLLLLLDALHGDALLRRLLALAVVAAFLLCSHGWRGHWGILVLLWVRRYRAGLLGVGVGLGIGVVLGIGLGWGGRGVGVAVAVRARVSTVRWAGTGSWGCELLVHHWLGGSGAVRGVLLVGRGCAWVFVSWERGADWVSKSGYRSIC